MKERPILFSAPMVRALLASSKTQTRRVCKPAATLSAVVAVQDPYEMPPGQRPPYLTPGWFGDEDGEAQFFSPYGAPGDRLWVRETHLNWWKLNVAGTDREFSHVAAFAADGYRLTGDERWIPSIHMLRAASRIDLEVTGVRVERLQDISEADAIAEGLVPQHNDPGAWGLPDGSHYHGKDPRISYWSLWEAINGPGSAEANPWVWVVEFKRIKP